MNKKLTDEIIEKIYDLIDTPDTDSDKNSMHTDEDEILKNLKPETHGFFKTYSDKWFDIVCEEHQKGFVLGFREGVKFFVEIITD